MTESSDVLAAQNALDAAMRKADNAAVGERLANDFSFVEERGRLLTRVEFFKELAALAPQGAETDLAARVHGEIALVTGRRRSGRGTDVHFTTLWIKDAGDWRALIHQDNVLGGKDETPAHPAPEARPPDAKPPECDNPLKSLPYQPVSDDERDIIKAFQQLETAVVRNDADEWVHHVADEFVVTRTRQHPTTKAQRAAAMRRLGEINAETFVAEVVSMRLWVKDDAAVMQAQHVMPGDRRPPYRAARVWVKRDGRWQMAMSQQTTIVE